MGNVVEAFLETAVVQTRGEWAGRKLVLDEWQREFLREAFLVDPATGLRVYQTIYLGLPAKNGKSMLASGLALYGLLFDGASGVLEGGPQVFSAANSAAQARVVFDEAKHAARQSKVLAPRLQIMEHSITVPGRPGAIMRPLASDSKGIHGVNPSMGVVDELGAARSGDILTILAKSKSTRRQPLTIVISHVGVERHGPLGQAYDHFQEHPALEVYGTGEDEPLLQVVRDRGNRALFWWYGLQEGFDPEDPEVWMKCNPASWQTVEKLWSQRNDPALEWREFCRYHLNSFTAAEDSLLPEGAWQACANEDMTIPRGAQVYLGIDGASKHDYGAISVVEPRLVDERWLFFVEAYVYRSEDSQTSILKRIRNQVTRLGQMYRVMEAHYDPHMMTGTADDLEDEAGVVMVEYAQSEGRLTVGTSKLVERIMDVRVRHNGDAELTKHFAQAATVETERGRRISKRKSVDKIDGAVATMMAIDAADNGIRRGDVGPGSGLQIIGG